MATELELRVDAELGNDTEHQRVTYLKYFNFGKQIATESAGLVTKADADLQAKAAGLSAVVEIEAAIEKCRVLQADVERDDEKAVFAGLQFETDASALYKAIGQMLKKVDDGHSALISARNEEIAAIKAKYQV